MLFNQVSARLPLSVSSVRGLAFVSLWLAVLPLSVQAGKNITLAWNPSSDGRTAGYKIHYGLASQNYDQTVDVGNATSATLAIPADGSTYYFVATAYDQTGVESPFSNEATFNVPAAPTLASARSAAGQFSFAVNGTSSATYVVEASTNLVDWVPVQTNTAPFTFVDTHVASLGRCFYRTVQP